MAIPSKLDCFYILEMLESELIDYRYIHPWADDIILSLDSAPSWLGDLATKKYRPDQSKALREYILSQPFETRPDGMPKFHIACIWLRHERRELSWATFLRLTGEYLDGSTDWECETPYHYLNIYESAYFSAESERQTKNSYFSDQNLKPWIAMAKDRFEPFRKIRQFKLTDKMG